MNTKYKVMTFNLLYGGHEGEPVSIENRKPRMLEVIRSELPDPDSGVKLQKRYKKRDSMIPKDDNVEFLIFPPDIEQ